MSKNSSVSSTNSYSQALYELSKEENCLENIEKEITDKTKVIAITHLSNVTGAILPIKEIINFAHSKGIPVLVDGCQGAPHLKLDIQYLCLL